MSDLRPAVTVLIWSALVLAGFEVLHSADHLILQDRELPLQVAAIGVLEGTGLALVIWLALRRDPFAPTAAMLVGGGTALAFITVHLVPEWGALSDPYADASLDPVSWAIMFGGLAAATALFAAGIRAAGAPKASAQA